MDRVPAKLQMLSKAEKARRLDEAGRYVVCDRGAGAATWQAIADKVGVVSNTVRKHFGGGPNVLFTRSAHATIAEFSKLVAPFCSTGGEPAHIMHSLCEAIRRCPAPERLSLRPYFRVLRGSSEFNELATIIGDALGARHAHDKLAVGALALALLEPRAGVFDVGASDEIPMVTQLIGRIVGDGAFKLPGSISHAASSLRDPPSPTVALPPAMLSAFLKELAAPCVEGFRVDPVRDALGEHPNGMRDKITTRAHLIATLQHHSLNLGLAALPAATSASGSPQARLEYFVAFLSAQSSTGQLFLDPAYIRDAAADERVELRAKFDELARKLRNELALARNDYGSTFYPLDASVRAFFAIIRSAHLIVDGEVLDSYVRAFLYGAPALARARLAAAA